MKEGENNVYTMDTIENKCSICKGRPTRAHRKIWDGKDFIEMGEPYLETFELYELQCMAFSVEMKDHWSDSDFKGMDLIRRIIQEKKMKMNKEVKNIQKYLKSKGADATEDEIIDAAIRIATRWGGNYVFVCELKKLGDKKDESNK